MKRAVATFLTGSALACAPLTFSDPGAIDFERYQSALVQGDEAEYLAGELRDVSGFEAVTTDPSVEVDLVIFVATSVSEEVECECEYHCDDEGFCEDVCTCDTEFHATASYEATTPAGHVVDKGSETDTSGSHAEAIEDALDEVALHYIGPYRL